MPSGAAARWCGQMPGTVEEPTGAMGARLRAQAATLKVSRNEVNRISEGGRFLGRSGHAVYGAARASSMK
ncbi:hypothetical protein GCM10007886_16350 [Methylobacterium gregans]|nr:hypothetical protein GCM10007886_16350 [Methylobacterium gregans]